jgi:hypothetical protein
MNMTSIRQSRCVASRPAHGRVGTQVQSTTRTHRFLLGLAALSALITGNAHAQLSNPIGFETCASGAAVTEVTCAGIATLSTPSGAPVAVAFGGRFGSTGSVALYSDREPVTVRFSPTVSEVRLDVLAADAGAEVEAYSSAGLSLGMFSVASASGATPVQLLAPGIARIEVRNPAGEFGIDALQTSPEGAIQGCPVGRDGCNPEICEVPYRVGGELIGLASGDSLVLQLDGGEDLTLLANGNFQFPSPRVNGSAYSVTVATQPAGSSCSIGNGSGTIESADVDDVLVDCRSSFTVGGTLSGLATGASVTLTNNGGDALTLSNNGSFSFPTPIADGSAYLVAVSQRPTAPNQTCSVSAGSGNVTGGPVTTVSVSCSTDSYAVGGTLSGLATGASVTLTNNGGDALTLSNNGSFSFPTPIADGSAYLVAVSQRPTAPNQTCSVSAGSGNVTGGPVTTVSVSCSTDSYAVGGTLSGLATGASVTLTNNGGDALTLSSNGSFSFPTPIADGSAYLVAVSQQPTAPSQTCSVSAGSGNVTGGPVTTVSVSCSTDSYAVGGTLSGLATGASVTLTNNGGDALTLSSNGSFSFPTPIADGSAYLVAVSQQPTAPNQTCSVSAGSGNVTGGPVTTVNVSCSTDSYAVGGTLSGLATGASVTLTNNGGDALTLSSNGSFSFPTPIADGSAYLVAVSQQPTAPSQTCSVSAGSGNVTGGPVTTVSVSCSTDSYLVTPIAGPGGALSPSSPQTAAAGATVSFEVLADPGFAISRVEGCGGSLAGSRFTTGAINANCEVEARFIRTSISDTSPDGSRIVNVAGGSWEFAELGNGALQSAGFIPSTGHPKSPPGTPPGVQFPTGLVDFVLVNGGAGTAASLVLTYPQAPPAGAQFWTYGPTAANPGPHWYLLPVVVSGNTVQFTLTDGIDGDRDLVANAAIVFVGGFGIPQGAAQPAVVPVNSPWGLLALTMMLAAAGWRARRRAAEGD